MLSEMEKLISDDGYAASFQSLGQYRTALLAALRAQADAQPVAYDAATLDAAITIVQKARESLGAGAEYPYDSQERDAVGPHLDGIEDRLRELYTHPAPEAAQALSDKALKKIIRSLETAHTGMCYGDEKRGSITEYARGFGACIEGLKRAILTRASAVTVTEPREQRLYTPDQMREYVEACYQARTRLMRTDPTNSVLANLVNAIRWWGAQEDGIPAEVVPAFNAAHLALGWSLSHPMDFDAANKQADQQQANPDTHRHEWNAEGERCLKCGEKDWFASSTCSGKAAQQQAEPVGDEREADEIYAAWIAAGQPHSVVAFQKGYQAAQSGQRAGVTRPRRDQEAAYNSIDRFLRNNLCDEDYAEYSAELDSLLAATPTPAAQGDQS